MNRSRFHILQNTLCQLIFIALYIILSLDVPLLKSDFFLRPEFLFGLSVGIFRAVVESNPPGHICRQELMDS